MMSYLVGLSFIELFYLVATVWFLFGVIGWPLAQIQMRLFGIKSIYGRSMSLMECLEDGPVSLVMLASALQCPEVLEKMQKEWDEAHGDH